MAERPLQTQLLANLPTDWTNDQYVTADGDMYADERYGYNYLNEQINDAQNAINTIDNAIGNLQVIDIYGVHPTSLSTEDQYVNHVAQTTTTSIIAVPNSSITITNPWGNAQRKIQIIADVQCRTHNNSSTSYYIGTHVYLMPSLTWNNNVRCARSTCQGSTNESVMGAVTLYSEATSTGDYPISLHFARHPKYGNVATIMNWSIKVVQTKL